ncbi:MAG: hypothetical protein IPG63_00570 [Xanthomonadales bacterium]|nr:hypothetical protein [Xanthomonadales bacterium]
MNKTKKHSLALLLGMLASGVGRSDAAEWTTTVDIYESETAAQRNGDAPTATEDAIWLGPSRALDPITGADISPYTIPEKIDLVGYMSGVSSRRGKIWQARYPIGFFGHDKDASGGFWDSHQAVYLAADGAQYWSWNGASLGHPDMNVVRVQPRMRERGAIVLLTNATRALAVQLDPLRGVIREFTVPTCSKNAAEDRHGGLYALCEATSPLAAGTLHHLPGTSGGAWSRQVMQAFLSRDGISADGGVLVLSPEPSAPRMQSIDIGGRIRFSRSERSGVAVQDGFWFHDAGLGKFTRVSSNGSWVTQVSDARATAYAAHPGGTLVLAYPAAPSEPAGFGAYRIHSGNGMPLRDLPGTEFPTATRTRIEVSSIGGSAAAYYDDGVEALDSNGRPLAPRLDTPRGRALQVLADSNNICAGYEKVQLGHPHVVRCYSRRSGTTADVTGGRLLHLNGTLVTASGSALEVWGSELTLVNRISLADALDYHLHPTQGIAVLRSVDGAQRLLRYRLDGSPMFDVAAPIATGEAIVGVGSDGSTVVAETASPATVFHYSQEGTLLAQRDVALPAAAFSIIAVDGSAHGVQLLAAAAAQAGMRDAQLLLLDRGLELRGQHDFRSPDTTSYPGPRLWPARLGAARLGYEAAFGLLTLQYRPGQAVAMERKVLPISGTTNRFNVDPDGTVRAMTADDSLGRDVLRISHPTPSAFTGPIRQSALTGSWYSPASTGQGLLLQLLNGNVLFGAWHTYAPEGGNALSKQQWFTVTGEVANERGRITLPIYRNGNGRFDTDGTTPSEAVGSAELVFTSCDQMEFWYRIGADTGAFPLQRLTPRTQTCDDGSSTQPPLDAAKGLAIDGAWYVPSQSGQGLTFNTSGARFGSYLAGWFTYDTEAGVDDEAAQHWFTLQGATPEHFGESVTAQIHRTIGGSRAGEPTRNTHAVGEATLTVHDCAHATLSYRFDDSVIAGSFANLQRSVALVRLGACPQ